MKREVRLNEILSSKPRESHQEKDSKPLNKGLKKDKETIKEIVDFLNSTLERSFKYQSVKTQKFIKTRLSEGFILGDFKLVIEDRAEKWRNDGHMKEYLRPETLFGTKMEGYLQEAKDNKRQSKEVIA